MATLMFFRFRTASTSSCIFPSCVASPGIASQWSKTHWGNACPLVAARSAETKPKDSETGRCAFTCTSGVPSRGFSSKTQPRLMFRQLYTPLIASIGQVISTRKMGSWSVGFAVSSAEKQHLRVGGMIWPAPRWIASAWSVQSMMLKRMPRMFSSQRGPSFVAHWNALFTCSLISLRYWIACVWSTTMFAPSVSGPQHQIFRVAFSSQSNFSRRSFERSLISAFGPAAPASMAMLSSSSMGVATR
mmetsp:Transcript_123876/g.350741  ORF Transcript_123876/g.350741 Transcript_123876/m.350741 type:complete len:245 (-) Transcript_123876:51-785(-)